MVLSWHHLCHIPVHGHLLWRVLPLTEVGLLVVMTLELLRRDGCLEHRLWHRLWRHHLLGWHHLWLHLEHGRSHWSFISHWFSVVLVLDLASGLHEHVVQLLMYGLIVGGVLVIDLRLQL